MVLLAKSTNFIIGPLAIVFGYIMEALFLFTSKLGVTNIGLSIILFTLITKLLLMPLTIKQQRFSRLSSLMNPELQELMRKYQGKTDTESMLRMREEQKLIYEKYGTSQSAGCIQLLIQMPIIFALYSVIRNIPSYVPAVNKYFTNITDGNQGLFNNLSHITEYSSSGKSVSKAVSSLTSAKTTEALIDKLNSFGTSEWNELCKIYSGDIGANIKTNSDSILEINRFFGINLADKPQILSISVLIPILAAVTQWLSVKISQAAVQKRQQGKFKEPEINNSMAVMNGVMPVISAIFCLTFPAGIGLYWIAQSVFTIFIQLGVNKYFDSQDINDIIAKNQKKMEEKRERQGLPPKSSLSQSNSSSTAGRSDSSLASKARIANKYKGDK
ncbi:MAG TPA: preprotein translocase YidC [Eubacterium sp.]|nr:preprotein translocase YidC [Eubacterium sp.]